MKNFIYHKQIVHHKPCFNLFILHNNLFDNQASDINKNDMFCTLRHTFFYENFLPTLLYSLSLYTYMYICIDQLPSFPCPTVY